MIEWLSKIDVDFVVMLILAIGLFWSLLLISKRPLLSDFFAGADGKKSIKSLLGAYLTISYSIYAGAVSLAKNELPDFPWAVVALISALLGLASGERITAIVKGQPVPPPDRPEGPK